MRLGNTDIASVKLGSSQVQAVYLGSNLVWQNAPVAIAATGVGQTSFTANWEAYSGAIYYLLDVSEFSDFSTFVYENEIVYAPNTSYVVIGLESNTTYYYRVRAAVEADVQAFFQRVSDAGGALTVTEQVAIVDLVQDLKDYGLWTKMKAIYPMVGASAAACAQNLKSASFTGSFSSGWTFASTGVLSQTGAYMDTNLKPSEMSQNSIHFGFYNRSNLQGNYKMGVYVVSPAFKAAYLRGTNLTNDMDVNSSDNGTLFQRSDGMVVANRTDATEKMVFNNGVKTSRLSNSVTPINNFNFYLNGLNNSGTSSNAGVAEFCFATFGDGLSDDEADDFYTAVQGFNTTLDRYVGAPWYDNGELLLDTYPDSAAAYSLRKLRNNYVGGPIRVRRSSDNTEQDIYFDANGELDTAQLTTFCGAGDGFVKTWYDQSGNARDATQATAANQPKIVNSGIVLTDINGKPRIQGFQTNLTNLKATFTLNQPISIFGVVNYISSSGFPYAVDLRSSSGNIVGIGALSSKGRLFAGASLLNTLTLVSNTTYLSYGLLNGTNSSIVINTTVTDGNAGTNNSDGLTFFNSQDIGGAPLNGFLSEVIIYGSNQSLNRTGISTNINDFYSIY